MRKIFVMIPVGFQQFIDMAEAIIKAHNYGPEEDVINLAKHQSVIHQTEAFDKALSLIPNIINCNVAVEPHSLTEDHVTCFYQASYVTFMSGPDDPKPEEVLEVIKENNKEDWAIAVE